MRIAFFTDAYTPQLNGVATSVEVWSRALEEKGHQVYIIAPKYPKVKDRPNVFRLNSFKFRKQPEIRLATYLPNRSILKISQLDFDVIHGLSGGPVTSLGLVVSKLKRVPFIFTYYTKWNQYTHYFLKGVIIKPKMIEGAVKLFGNRCDILTVPVDHIKQELMSYGIKRPIEIVPGGIDIAKFKEVKKGFLSNKLKLDSKERILLYVGRLGKEKSVDLIIKAFSLVNIPRVSLVIVGDGPDKNKLGSVVKKLNLKNVYFTGPVKPADVPKVYADAYGFLFASTTETQGLVIVEALASGIPVIAVRDPVIEEVVKHNVNGLLVENSINSFAAAILKLLKSRALREKLAKKTKTSVEKFSMEQTANELLVIYQKQIRGSKKRTFSLDQAKKLFLKYLYE